MDIALFNTVEETLQCMLIPYSFPGSLKGILRQNCGFDNDAVVALLNQLWPWDEITPETETTIFIQYFIYA